ncbi:MAG: ExbD/TolR family protein [Gammaproteobacteria bacterium]
MNLRKPRQDDVEINLISLIDVLLFLVIFFLVSTTFVEKSEIALTLPEATADATPQKDNTIDLGIDAGGHYHIDGVALADHSLSGIEQALARAAKDKHHPTVIVKADEQTTHQAVVTALDAARRQRLYRITFATENPPE